MNTETENPQGFAFPGVFEITAMGSASANLQTAIPHELEQAGLTVLHETVSNDPADDIRRRMRDRAR